VRSWREMRCSSPALRGRAIVPPPPLRFRAETEPLLCAPCVADVAFFSGALTSLTSSSRSVGGTHRLLGFEPRAVVALASIGLWLGTWCAIDIEGEKREVADPKGACEP